MSWTEIEIDESGNITVRRGGTLTGETKVETSITSDDILRRTNGVLLTRRNGTLTDEPMTEPEPEPEPEPKPKLVVWRRCVPVEHSLWIESGQIPSGWVALEAHTQPVETIQQLPEGQKP